MKTYQTVIVFLIGLVLVTFAFSFIPGSEQIKTSLLNVFLWLIQTVKISSLFLFTFFFLPFVFGMLVKKIIVNLDAILDPNEWLSDNIHLIFALLFSTLGGLVEIQTVQYVLTTPWMLGSFMTWLMQRTIVFETPPVEWFIWGGFVFFVGYVTVSNKIDIKNSGY